ncbi:GNAT family N-acetyltransferase, partial [bacterium]|nr:GNAT family N-acetyltransferase [bacterium]
MKKTNIKNKNSKSVLCVIQARMGSTRLPGKVLKTIDKNTPMIAYQIRRVRMARGIGKIVVATTTEPTDDKLAALCKKLGVDCFRGSVDDVLTRYGDCAAHYPLYSTIMRLTGDCPLIDPAILDSLIKFFNNSKLDYASTSELGRETYPNGIDAEIFTKNILEKALEKAELASEREHVTLWMRTTKSVKKGYISDPYDFSHIRLTVDNMEDLPVLRFVVKKSPLDAGYLHYISILTKYPDMWLKNNHIRRNEGLARSLRNDYNIKKHIIPEITRIEGERVILRSIKIGDASAKWCAWLDDPEVNKYLETKGTTFPELKQYVRKKTGNPDILFLGIFARGENKHIGTVKLEPIDRKNKKATLGIMIGDKNYWGKGIATEVMRLMINHAFNALNLDEVNLGVIADHKSAVHVYEKVGF